MGASADARMAIRFARPAVDAPRVPLHPTPYNLTLHPTPYTLHPLGCRETTGASAGARMPMRLARPAVDACCATLIDSFTEICGTNKPVKSAEYISRS